MRRGRILSERAYGALVILIALGVALGLCVAGALHG